jgi:hypothetical protein
LYLYLDPQKIVERLKVLKTWDEGFAIYAQENGIDV